MSASTNTTPARALPLFRPMHAIFGPSVEDRWVGAYRRAAAMVDGWADLDRKACKKIGRANAHNPAWKRQSQSEAFSNLNRIRAQRRANYRTMDEARDALLALGFDIAQLAPQRLECADHAA